jgi:hypothetical protein
MTNFDEPRRARVFCRLGRSTVGPRLAHAFEVGRDTVGEKVGDDPGNLGKRPSSATLTVWGSAPLSRTGRNTREPSRISGAATKPDLKRFAQKS